MQVYQVDKPLQRYAMTTLIINVNDVNDHAPKLLGNSSYDVEVEENPPAGHVILKMRATDEDEVGIKSLSL